MKGNEESEEQQDFVKDITKMSVDFDRWYTDVVRKAEMADWSGVRELGLADDVRVPAVEVDRHLGDFFNEVLLLFWFLLHSVSSHVFTH